MSHLMIASYYLLHKLYSFSCFGYMYDSREDLLRGLCKCFQKESGPNGLVTVWYLRSLSFYKVVWSQVQELWREWIVFDPQAWFSDVSLPAFVYVQWLIVKKDLRMLYIWLLLTCLVLASISMVIIMLHTIEIATSCVLPVYESF